MTLPKLIWTYFWDTWHFLERAGRWSLDPIHQDVLEAVLNTFPEVIAQEVRRQLEYRYFLSWMSEGRVNVLFFYNENEIPLISVGEYCNRLYKVDIIVEGIWQKVNIVFTRGRIHRIEFMKPSSYFKGKNYCVGAVSIGKSSNSFTRIIDRGEHGKETEINP